MKIKKFFLLDWQRILLIIGVEIVFVILHNLVSAWLGLEEALFFILAIFITPIYFFVSLIYSLLYWLKRGRK